MIRKHPAYTGVVDAAGLDAIVALGVDRHEVGVVHRRRPLRVEVILTDRQADALARSGVDLVSSDTGAAT